MNILDKFRAALGADKVDEILQDAGKAAAALDAQGVERKALDDAAVEAVADPVAEATPAEQPAAPAEAQPDDAAVLETLARIVDERLAAFADQLGKSLGESTRKALDDQQATYEARITDLSAQVKALKEADEARATWMPRSVRDTLARASTAAETALTTKQAAGIKEEPGDTEGWGILKVTKPGKRG